jgi:hypothetical protein
MDYGIDFLNIFCQVVQRLIKSSKVSHLSQGCLGIGLVFSELLLARANDVHRIMRSLTFRAC